jgi:hypothetical protein
MAKRWLAADRPPGESGDRMKKLLYLAVALAGLTLTSCFEHHAVLKLNKDGSGTITEETVLSGQVVAMMDQMAAMGGETAGGPKDMADPEKAKEAAARMGEGVTVEKVEEINEEGRKGARIVYAFEDVNQLKYTPGGALSDAGSGMAPGGAEAAAKENDPMQLEYKDGVLTLRNPAPEKKEEGEAAETPDAGEIDPSQLEMAKQMLDGMRISMKIELPGGIDETNATHVDGNTVILMDMDMGALMKDGDKFMEFVKEQPDTPAEMEELVKGVEGVKVETKDPVTIKLK